MKKFPILLLLIGVSALAQVPTILLEACNQMEPASKRLECLKAAAGTASKPQASQPLAATASSRLAAPSTAGAAPTSSGQTCFVGPRGGTYTITRSGKKNYGGC
jgi:pectin methylesterase-like acyl-CoA thioesterase